MATEQVRFDKNKGPVTLEVTSGYSSLGSFLLFYSEKASADFKEFGKDPKKIDDNIPDMYLIPADPQNLEKYLVFVIGKYRPAPGHNQIKVTYSFIQDNNVVHQTEIQETTSAPFIRFKHGYEFKSA